MKSAAPRFTFARSPLRTFSHLRVFLRRHASLDNYLFAFCFLLGFLFVFVVPPFQKPDETTHFFKAISVASGNIVCTKDASESENGVFHNFIPKYLADFPNQMYALHIASSPQNVFPRSLYWRTLTEASVDRTLVNEPTSCALPFLLYVPLGAALFLPVHFGWNPLVIFYLGRLFHFCLAFFLFWWAYRVAPKRTKLLPLLILSLPIVLLQISSFSKDALHLSAGIVALSYLLAFLETKKKISVRDVLLFLCCTAVAVLARPQYILFSGLPLLLPFNKLKKMKRMVKIACVGFVFLILGLIALSLSQEIYSAKATSLGQEHPNGFVYPSLQLQFLRERPLAFPGIINQTLEKNSNFYLLSAISVLGWLEFRLPWYVSLLYVGFAVYVFLKARSSIPVLSLWQFLLMGGIMAGTFGGIFLAFYLYATPVGSSIVLAPQGRYFLLLVPYLFWLLVSFMHYFQHKFIGAFFILILLATMSTLFFRYYSPNQHFYAAVDAMPAVSRADSTIVEKPLRQVFGVDAQKKITGYRFFIFQRLQTVNKPYELEVRDVNCATVLRKEVIDVSSLKYDDWNDVLFSPLSGERVLCVTLQPYATSIPEPEAIQLALQKDKSVLAIPLYVY
jgi:uncharacterized membrane protein